MTEQEILDIGEWINGSYVLKINSTVFDKIIPIEINFDQGEERILSQKSIGAIIDFLKLKDLDLEEINQKIWENCLACNQSQTSKGSSDGGKTWFDTSTTLEENLNEWNIKTKEDALNKTEIQSVWIANTWGLNSNGNIFYVNISTEWDDEHGLTIIYKNGSIDCVE